MGCGTGASSGFRFFQGEASRANIDYSIELERGSRRIILKNMRIGLLYSLRKSGAMGGRDTTMEFARGGPGGLLKTL